jgi:hypothetical protein
MNAGVEIEGMEKLIRLLALGGAGARQALRQALYMKRQLRSTNLKCKFQLTRVCCAIQVRLMESKSIKSEIALVITLGYGGVAAPYALRVHEDLGARHNSPTKAKYLEDPVKMRLAGMGTRLTTAVDNALGRLA